MVTGINRTPLKMGGNPGSSPTLIFLTTPKWRTDILIYPRQFVKKIRILKNQTYPNALQKSYLEKLADISKGKSTNLKKK